MCECVWCVWCVYVRVTLILMIRFFPLLGGDVGGSVGADVGAVEVEKGVIIRVGVDAVGLVGGGSSLAFGLTCT